MAKHLQREIESLQKKLMSLSAIVEEQVRSAVRALESRNISSAHNIINFDSNIDLMEIEVEEDCLKMLALYQPVAVDLRFIVAVLKINNDLERVADLASNIAESATRLTGTNLLSGNPIFTLMCDKALLMLRQCLDALFNRDANKASEVCVADDEIDNMNREIIDIVKKGISEHKDRINDYFLFLSVARNLERIADHATNIAEDVIYMIEGDIVRHRGRKKIGV